MNFQITIIIATNILFQYGNCGNVEIVSAARSQIGVPYAWGGGNTRGKTNGIDYGFDTIGFDCSGLALYAVYQGTGILLAHHAADQYLDRQCTQVEYSKRLPGDLVFFAYSNGEIHHVGIVSGEDTFIEAPHTGDFVKESSLLSPIRVTERVSNVLRCW